MRHSLYLAAQEYSLIFAADAFFKYSAAGDRVIVRFFASSPLTFVNIRNITSADQKQSSGEWKSIIYVREGTAFYSVNVEFAGTSRSSDCFLRAGIISDLANIFSLNF